MKKYISLFFFLLTCAVIYEKLSIASSDAPIVSGFSVAEMGTMRIPAASTNTAVTSYETRNILVYGNGKQMAHDAVSKSSFSYNTISSTFVSVVTSTELFDTFRSSQGNPNVLEQCSSSEPCILKGIFVNLPQIGDRIRIWDSVGSTSIWVAKRIVDITVGATNPSTGTFISFDGGIELSSGITRQFTNGVTATNMGSYTLFYDVTKKLAY